MAAAVSMVLRSASRFVGAVIVLGALLAGVAYALLAASLPRRSGEAPVANLTAPLTIELDTRAIPRIRVATFADAL